MCWAVASLTSLISSIWIHSHKGKEMWEIEQTRKVWNDSLLSGGQEWLSVVALCWGPSCSVTFGRWPKGMKMAPDTAVTKEYVLFDVLLLTDLDPQYFIAGARSSNPYMEVSSFFSLCGEWEMGWKQARLLDGQRETQPWRKHTAGGVPKFSSLLMPGWVLPFSLRHQVWLLGALPPHSAF